MRLESQTPQRAGAQRVIIATAVAGGAGYVLTVYAGMQLGDGGYARFATFWSAIFLVVSAVGGIQQEVARASRPTAVGATREVGGARSRRTIGQFALLSSGSLLVVLLSTLPIWSPRVFGDSGGALAVAASIGVAAYVFLAISIGLSFGVGAIRVATLLMMVEGVLRLLLTGGAIALGASATVVAWAIVLPFALAPLALAALLRRDVWGSLDVDASLRRLTWNAGRTIGAAAATGVVVSGLPLLVAATSHGASTPMVSTLMYAITTIRAPLVVVALAFQSFLVVALRPPSSARRVLPRILLAIGISAFIAAAAAYVWGPGVLAYGLGSDYRVSAWLLAIVVASAGPVAALFVTGAATLARGMHGAYTLGWLVTAILTVAVLLLPATLEVRLSWALLAPPFAGLTIHLAALVLRREPSSSNEARDSADAAS